MKRNYKIAVAGTGYVGLSIATLLSQHHQVTAVDIIPEKVDLINKRKSPKAAGLCAGARRSAEVRCAQISVGR